LRYFTKKRSHEFLHACVEKILLPVYFTIMIFFMVELEAVCTFTKYNPLVTAVPLLSTPSHT